MEPISFFLPGRIIPKARPRFNGFVAHLPTNYRVWKSNANIIIQSYGFKAIAVPVYLKVIIVGFKRGDCDNILGSIQDALVDAGVLPNDGINQIPKASIEYQDSPRKIKNKPKLVGALVSLSHYMIQTFMLPLKEHR